MREKVLAVAKQIDRKKFIDDEIKEWAEIDAPLPIGKGQTISQPSLVMQMTILLKVEKHHKVLEIGTGSGYQTAFLSHLAKEVYSVELISKLSVKAKERLEAMGYDNINFFVGDGSIGLKEEAPFDRIIVTAGANEIPNELLEQLAPNGIMVIPVGPSHLQTLKVVTKDNEDKVIIEGVKYVKFVEFKGKYGWSYEKQVKGKRKRI